MKKFFFLLAAASIALCAACGPKDDPTTPPSGEATLLVDPASVSIAAEGGSATATITLTGSEDAITATAGADWLTATIDGKTLNITATANSGAARSADVTVAAGSLSNKVTVNQAAAAAGGLSDDGFMMDMATYDADSSTATENEGLSYHWEMDDEGLYITVTFSLAAFNAAESWGVGYFVIEPSLVDDMIGESVAETTLENFYPVEPDGTIGTAWTSYAPGQWVDATGAASDWSAGVWFWQYHVYASSTYDITVPGALFVGIRPGGENLTAGASFSCNAEICGKAWVVTLNITE